MERKKSKIAFCMVIFFASFISSVLFLLAEFMCKYALMLSTSISGYSTGLPAIAEPVLVGLSIFCFAVSIAAGIVAALTIYSKK